MSPQFRSKPNILVTGTPGVGKSTLCLKLQNSTGLNWFDVSTFAKDNNCVEECEETDVYMCSLLDEDKLLDMMEPHMGKGGIIVDYHGCDFFPERWFDIVFVLRTDNTTLYDRLSARGYSGKKLEDNVDCEIFQTILEEARESYDKNIVHELENSTQTQLEDNLARIQLWVQNWLTEHSKPMSHIVDSD